MTSLVEKISDESNFYPFTSEDYGITDEGQKSFIQKMNDEKNCFISGAFDGEELVGIVYLYGGNRTRNYHSTTLGIGVLNKYKGRGIGSDLIQKAINYAYDSDVIGKINVQVIKENIEAINFYKKNGFVVEGVEKRSLFIDGNFYDAFNFGLVI